MSFIVALSGYDGGRQEKFDGKISLVTGGISGIGQATAKQFAREGASAFITGRRESELAATVTEIVYHNNNTGPPGRYILADERRAGTAGYRLCKDCQQRNSNGQ
jgi:NAD(P)-dependent dehydrogenase (short-subunit alcohol dehydrogenase family)